MDLSVIIPCRNGLPWLAHQLDALANEKPEAEWEVVVADNGSSDGSAALARTYADRLPLRVVDASDRLGPAHARNVGVAASSGAALVFLDQDDVIGTGYLRAMLDGIRQHTLVAAAVDVDTLNPGWIGARFVPHNPQTAQERGFVAGAALGMGRSLFERLGGFDESIGVGDDLDICWRARRDGEAELHPCTDAILRYRFRTRLTEVLRQGIIYGKAAVALDQRWNPEYVSDAVGLRVWLGTGRQILFASTKAQRRSAAFLLGRWIGTAQARRS